MTWPTHLSAADPLRALSDFELRRRRQTRSTAVHNVRILWGGRKQTLQVKDQTVFDSEAEKGPDSVVWGSVPNRFGHYVHLVTTRRTQVEVLETRSPKGEPLTLTSNSGRYHVWKPNGAILRILRIWNRVEWLDPPEGNTPDPEVVVRRLDATDAPPPSPRRHLQHATEAAGKDLRSDAAKEFHAYALLHPSARGITIEASKPGSKLIRVTHADARTALDAFKSWLREEGEATATEVFDLMPRSAIVQAVRELARNRWAPTPDIVHLATNQKIAWSDARYPDFAQRISSDRQEPKGWHQQLAAEGIELQEEHFQIRGPSGRMVRVKHYRYDT